MTKYMLPIFLALVMVIAISSGKIYFRFDLIDVILFGCFAAVGLTLWKGVK